MADPVPRLSPEQGLDTFERTAAAFVAAARDTDLTAPVPTTPGWSLADLVGHTGSMHLWARDAVLTGTAGDEPERPQHADDRHEQDRRHGRMHA